MGVVRTPTTHEHRVRARGVAVNNNTNNKTSIAQAAVCMILAHAIYEVGAKPNQIISQETRALLAFHKRRDAKVPGEHTDNAGPLGVRDRVEDLVDLVRVVHLVVFESVAAPV